MAIKQQGPITRQDFEDALESLRVSVAEVARDTAIPRSYLSELRNHGTPLRRDFAEKLKTYFEGKGIEFDSKGSRGGSDSRDQPSDITKTPHPRLSVGAVCFFPIRADLSDERVRAAMQEIDRDDKRIAELLVIEATREAAFVGEGEYSEETQEAGRELFALCAANYMLVRYLTGTDNPLAQPIGQDRLGAILLETMREGIERAGIEIATSPGESPEEVEA